MLTPDFPAMRLARLLLSLCYLLPPVLHAAAPDAPAYPVTDGSAVSPRSPSVARQPDGTTLVVWLEQVSTFGNRVMARAFTAAGSPLGSVQRVDDGSSNGRSAPDVAALPDGGFVLTWVEGNGAIVTRPLSATATPTAPASEVEVPAAMNPVGPADAPLRDLFPAVAVNANGDQALAWQRCRVINSVRFLPIFALSSTALSARCSVLLRLQRADGTATVRSVTQGEARYSDLFLFAGGAVRDRRAPSRVDVGIAGNGTTSVVWHTDLSTLVIAGLPNPEVTANFVESLHLARFTVAGLPYGLQRVVAENRDPQVLYGAVRIAVDTEGTTAVAWGSGGGNSNALLDLAFIDRAPLAATRRVPGIEPAGAFDVDFAASGRLAVARAAALVDTLLIDAATGSRSATIVDTAPAADESAVGGDGSGGYIQVWRANDRLFARGYRQP